MQRPTFDSSGACLGGLAFETGCKWITQILYMDVNGMCVEISIHQPPPPWFGYWPSFTIIGCFLYKSYSLFFTLFTIIFLASAVGCFHVFPHFDGLLHRYVVCLSGGHAVRRPLPARHQALRDSYVDMFFVDHEGFCKAQPRFSACPYQPFFPQIWPHVRTVTSAGWAVLCIARCFVFGIFFGNLFIGNIKRR